MTAAFRPKLVQPPISDAEHLAQLQAQRVANLAALAQTDADIAALTRRWSAENGYLVNLTPVQMARALEASS